MLKKPLLFVLLMLATATGVFVFSNFLLPLLRPSIGQLSVTTPYQSSKVYLDNQSLGSTPFYSQNLKTGDHTLKVDSDGATWQTKTTLSANTFSSLDLNLSKSENFTSGENLFFRRGERKLLVLSKPNGAKLLINGEDKGSTPANIALSAGVYTLNLKKDGYLSREITPNIVNDYSLSIDVFLSLDPFGDVKKIDGSDKISLFSLHNNFVDLSKSYSNWAAGVEFTQKQLATTETRFDVLIDPNGKTYVLNETEWKNKVSSKAVSNVGYLQSKKDDPLTDKASVSWQAIKTQFN